MPDVIPMLSPNEQIAALFDDGTFTPAADAGSEHDASIGWGSIEGRRVFMFAQRALEPGPGHITLQSEAICKAVEMALTAGAPLVALWGTDDDDTDRSLAGLAAYGRILDHYVQSSGIIPRVSLVGGRLTGGWSKGAALSDLTVVVDRSTVMFINDPASVKTVTAEEVTEEELGGARTHASRTGLGDLIVDHEVEGLQLIRYLLSYLPDNNLQSPPYFPPTDNPDRLCAALEQLIPNAPNVPYNVIDAVTEIVDDGEFLELKQHSAANLVTGLARLDGHALGIVASQPSSLAGTLDIASSIKGARFVRFCDAFNIPLLTIVDTPGFRPGVQEEYRGIIRHGAKLVYAFAEATVPRITLITRKAYGGAYIVMNSRHIRADLSFAWPTAAIAVMGAQGAAKIIHRKEIAAADDPLGRESVLVKEYANAFSNPYVAAERGYVDDVISPVDTRRKLIHGFKMLQGKREVLPGRKHGNIPL